MAIPLRARGRIAAAATGLLLLAGLAPATAAGPASLPLAPVEDLFPAVEAPTKAGTYIVQLADAPVVAYEGGIKGLKATKPTKGEKIDPRGRYVAHLQGKQDAALKAAGGGKKLYNYTYTFNGFAAELSAAAAAKLAQLDGVVAVTPDEMRQLDTSSTPDFLGLTDEGGLWDQLTYPVKRGRTTAGPGENVIVGIIDSGIWPEHPSVSDRDENGKLVYQQIPGWHGKCTPGEDFNASMCNQKLIGAQYYNAGFGGNAGIDATFDYEFNSARDADGHGTHTATTAGGNAGVEATGPAEIFGSVSGIAPRARIAAYKVCWGNNGEGGCFGVDSVAAIDQAVADGVDVINFSISGTSTNFRDPVEIAFLYAADAGVFVAASAGNAGPTESTVAHPSPWITTVAAGTHNRNGQGSVTLDNGATYEGASFATQVGPLPLVDAAHAIADGATPVQAELCYPGALDPSEVEGKIVLCKRGAIALVDKSLAVYEAGGAGMVLYNDPAGATNTLALFHSVPSVHLAATDGLAVKAYIASADGSATASIGDATVTYDADAPFTASFSSRGPLLAGGGDLLKPDVMAPGQDILAGVSPVGYNGRLFDLLSGTSMSSPHVAGLAALLIQAHPDWSPMAVKSALMTTAGDVLDGPNDDPEVIFSQGAGHVKPNAAVDPGLVFDSSWNDWLGFLCGTQLPTSFCTGSGIPVLDPSDFNSPSIAIGDLPGEQTVTRTVTNVSGANETYDIAVVGLDGFDVTIEPESFMVKKGESQEITFTFTRTDAELNEYVGGQVTMTGNKEHEVRIPAVIRPVALLAPASVSSDGSDTSYDVTFAYAGNFSATARGLVPARTAEGVVAQDPDQEFDPGDSAGTEMFLIGVAENTTYQRFALFDSDVAPGSDLDLFVFNPSGQFVGQSANSGSDEEVNLSDPVPGTYYVFVHGWGVPAGTSEFVLHDWSVPDTEAGNMTVSAPTEAIQGETGTIELSFTGLDPATRYLGSVVYGGPASATAPTLVEVTTPEEATP